MAVIKIVNFGGEAPRVSPRALPAEAAQINSNLLATSTEFRPLLGDTPVGSAPANTRTLYRLVRDASGALLTDPAAGWIAETADKNYVKGQINDDVTERTYVSFNDGSAPPRAIDATGADRLLGVPSPVDAPVATVTVVDEFTTEEAVSGDTDTHREIAAAIEASFVTGYQGNAISPMVPSASSVGWAPHAPGLPSMSPAQWNFMIPLVAGQMNGQYTYMTRPEFGGREVSYLGSTFFAVPIRLAAPAFSVDPVALEPLLAAIQNPSAPGEALLGEAEVASIVDSSVAYWSVTEQPQAGMIEAALRATNKVGLVITQTSGGQIYSTQAYEDAYNALVGTVLSPEGTATDRIGFQAVKMAETGIPAANMVPTPSRYWTGTTSTARANIRADIASCVSTSSTGRKVFDAARMSGLITADFELLLNQQEPGERADALRATLPGVVTYCLEPLREFFSFATQASLSGVTITGTDNASALLGAIAEANQALSALETQYATMRGQTPQAAKNSYDLAETPVERIVESRFYVQTFVTDWGEESAPSPVSEMIEPDQNDTVALELGAVPSGRFITKRRVYRSNSGSTAASFQFAMELPAETSTWEDDKKGEELGEVCPTIGPDGITYWLEPPTRLGTDGVPSTKPNPYLRGLVGMPNGVMAGHIDNFVAFCEPYHPFAWPIQYQIALKHEIVGLGVFGQSLFVGTLANPSIISGADSASMSEQVLDDAQACVSAKSIVSAGSGVLYASPDGICFANSGGVRVVTAGLFAREDWSALQPESILAVMHEGVYYFWYAGQGGGCYALDTVAQKLVRVELSATAVFADTLTDAVFYTTGSSIQRAFSGGRRSGTWKSGKAEIEAQAPLAWAKVLGDQSTATPITLTWAGDGVQRYTRAVTDTQPFRLPPGRYLEHEVTISGAARVTKVFLSSTTDELKGVA